MHVARGCKRVIVSKKLADHGKRTAGRCDKAGIAVPEIVEPHVVEICRLADCSPRLLQVYEMTFVTSAHDDIRVAQNARD